MTVASFPDLLYMMYDCSLIPRPHFSQGFNKHNSSPLHQMSYPAVEIHHFWIVWEIHLLWYYIIVEHTHAPSTRTICMVSRGSYHNALLTVSQTETSGECAWSGAFDAHIRRHPACRFEMRVAVHGRSIGSTGNGNWTDSLTDTPFLVAVVQWTLRLITIL